MNILANFSERLNELLSEHRYTTKSLHEKTGIPVSAINKYRNGTVAPSVEAALRLAELFCCSLDYLLGRKEDSRVRSFHACPPFGERLIFLLQENHCSQYRLCKDANISSSVLRHWLNGTHVPSLDNVVKLADFFGCSADYVLGREK